MTGWMRDAACLTDPGLPWTTDLPPVIVTLMADVCTGCPVRAQCRVYAAAEDITGAYWAGIDRDTLTTSTTARRSRRVRGAA